MNSLKRLDKLLIRGAISKEEYLKRIGVYDSSKGITVRTAEEITTSLNSDEKIKDS